MSAAQVLVSWLLAVVAACMVIASYIRKGYEDEMRRRDRVWQAQVWALERQMQSVLEGVHDPLVKARIRKLIADPRVSYGVGTRKPSFPVGFPDYLFQDRPTDD